MDSGNWIIDNLGNALNTWNDYLSQIWDLLIQSPQTFKDGGIWNVITNINGALQAVGYGLLVLFFLIGVVKTCGSFAELKRPEVAVKMFIRFILAKAVITYGMELMTAIFRIVQGVIETAMNAGGFLSSEMTAATIPAEIDAAVRDLPFLDSIPVWLVSLIGQLVVTVLCFIMIMSVYGRFFKLYMYTAVAPIPLSGFAGEPTSGFGRSFIKSYAAVCLEGAVIVLACIIFSVFASSPPVVQAGDSPTTMVWKYMGELIFNLLVLTGAVKMADRVVKEMMFGG